MADVKISALPAATTPLAGTEVLPIVQSSTTKKVAISDVTAGRAVSASSLTLTTPLGVASGGTGLTSLTAGYIPFGAGTSAFGNSANLFWDSANTRLGIGTSSPAARLSFGAYIPSNGQTIHTYQSGNTVSGLGIVAGAQRLFTNTGSVLTFGQIDTADGTTFYERMRIDSSGNVGIGTTSPRAPLSFLNTTSTAGTPNKIRLFDDGSTNLYGFNISPGFLEIIAGPGGGVIFYTNGANERMRITSGGFVGIGTSSPATILHVSTGDQSTSRLRLQNTGVSGRIWDIVSGDPGVSNINFSVYDATASATRLSIDSSGNVGIGTSSPTSLLTVAGPIATAAPTTKTANYSLTATDSSLIFNGSGSITLTLQAASSYPGRILYVKTIAAQTVVSASSNVVPVDSATAGTAILAATAGKWAMLQSDGTNWITMMAN